jgi:uncharacterized protein YkwD
MRRRRTSGLAGAVLVLLMSPTQFADPFFGPSAAADSLRSRLLEMVNGARKAHGLQPLKLNVRLSAEARQHTDDMIDGDRLFHSDLSDVLSPWDWDSGGENVGCASSLRKLHKSFMDSPEHRDMVLDPGFRKIGIGVVAAAGDTMCGRESVWGTEIFFG